METESRNILRDSGARVMLASPRIMLCIQQQLLETRVGFEPTRGHHSPAQVFKTGPLDHSGIASLANMAAIRRNVESFLRNGSRPLSC